MVNVSCELGRYEIEFIAYGNTFKIDLVLHTSSYNRRCINLIDIQIPMDSVITNNCLSISILYYFVSRTIHIDFEAYWFR